MQNEITVQELKKRMDEGENLSLLDVREADEREFASIGGQFIPLSAFGARFTELDPESELIVYCHHGSRSQSVVNFLMQKGFKNVKNLVGGIDAWSVLIDRTVKRY